MPVSMHFLRNCIENGMKKKNEEEEGRRDNNRVLQMYYVSTYSWMFSFQTSFCAEWWKPQLHFISTKFVTDSVLYLIHFICHLYAA